VHDEPQHVKQGKVSTGLLNVMGIDYTVLSKEEDKAEAQIKKAVAYMQATKQCYALVIEKDTFDAYTLQNVEKNDLTMSREEAIQTVAAALAPKDAIVSTTGMISRELFEYRTAMNEGHERDFLTVGSMGHALRIALGIARKCNETNFNRYVACLDGDGSSIMQMGNMAIAGAAHQPNLMHFVLNNAAHDSVGGQPTVGNKIDFSKIAEACGYYVADKFECGTVEDLKAILRERIDQAIYSWACDGDDVQTTFFEIKVAKGARKDLGRPKEPPPVNKTLFMETLSR
jgi:phosphonopyruvate decarboxylase